MDLPVNPPVPPMLAKPVDAIPSGDYVFEPKWDGFRSIVFRDGDEVEIGSRNERPMTRYFPELVAAIKAELPERCVIDGEIVIPRAGGWTSTRCNCASIRRLAASSCSPPRRRRTSSRSTCSRWPILTTWNGRSPSAGPRLRARWPRQAPPST
jgi:hypothetical protein